MNADPDFRVLSSHDSRLDADGVVALLRGCGIEALTSGGDLGGANPLLAEAFGVKVLVDASRLDEARAILAAGAAAPSPPPPLAPPGRLYTVIKLLWLAFVVLTAVSSYLKWDEGQPAPAALGGVLAILGISAFWLTIFYAWRRARRRRRE